MAPQLMDAIISGAPGLSVTLTAADLRKVVIAVMHNERERQAEERRRAVETPYLTKEEVARKLKISSRTLDNIIKRGEIGYTRIGASVRFAEADVQEYEDNNKKTRQ